MNLIQINEENKQEINKKIAIGIDLGTTNSLVAFSENKNPKILKADNELEAIKSILSLGENNQIIVGNTDKNLKSIKSIKRLMGKTNEDLSEELKNYNYDILEKTEEKIIKLNFADNITPIEASAEILKTLKKRAEKSLQTEINDAVITVPAYFDDAARNATIAAAKIANLNILRLINEPTAAALAYGFDKDLEGIYAIYDFGGGTFDVSILKMHKGIFQVIATKGDNFLGGDDLDIAIANYLADKFQITDNIALNEANLAKESLSKNKIYENKQLKITLHQEEFHEIIKPLINKTLDIFATAIQDAKINKTEIKETILVGGSTKISYLKKLLAEFLEKRALDNINPDNVVALGAALQAEYLTNSTGNLLIDIIPLSLGIETMGGITEKIIPRNSAIPISYSQKFTTFKDNQTGMQIHIVQGERELSNKNRSLGYFELKNIPKLPAGKAIINIHFNIDMDGILTVTAEEETSNIKQEIIVKPSYGLDEKQLMEILQKTHQNAKDDMIERLIAKNNISLSSYKDQIEKIIADKDYNFSAEEQKEAEEFCAKMQEEKEKLNKSNNYNQLEKLQKDTKEYLNNLCLKKINIITSSLEGKTIAEIDNLFKNKK